MKNKIWTVIVCFFMCISLTVTFNYSNTYAANSVEGKLDELISKYKNTYWTTDGKPSDTSGSTSKNYHGIQCKGFASYIFNELFGGGWIGSTSSAKYYITNPNGATEVGRASGFSSTDVNTVANLLNQGNTGDLIQVKRRGRTTAHTMILRDIYNGGITVFDCNADGHCKVQEYNISWSAFANANDGVSLYHSTRYPSMSIEQWVDDISGHVGMIHVKGWAIDMLNKTKSLQIDIYIGGPAGSKNVDIIGVMAKDVRTDVAAVYPGAGNYHGFDTEIYTWRSGSVPVYVYAHNAAMTDATLLLSKTVTVTADKTPPVISEVKVTNKTKDGYTISCKVTDNGAIAEVKFPTWTVANGDDDIVWVSGTKNGNYYSANIKVSDHKNEGGTYATHIYATDKNGNKSCNTSQENIYIDRTAPVISNVKISNIDETGYTVSCTATDNTGIKSVKFPTWTEKNGQDDLGGWSGSYTAYDGIKSGNTYTFRVKISAHGNQRGNYITHIYAEDAYGNYVGYTTTPIIFVPNKYTVAYSANGGSGAPGSQTKWEKTTLKLSTTKPYKNYTITYNGNGGTAGSANKSVGCTFKSWNTNAAGTGTAYNAGAGYNANASATLYAQWQNPAAGNLANASRTGYTFDGWYTAANGGNKVTAATTITGNTTLYAHWTIIKYSVAYNANGGSGAPGSQTKEYGKALTLSSTKPYKNYTITYNGNGGTAGSANKSVGCTFKSWNTNAAGTGTAYNAGAGYNANASATLYAQWQNPAAGNLANASRTGYTFDGWYTAANGGNKVTAATTITGNTTLYAHWTIIKYSVAYNANGGSGAPISQTKEYGKALTLSSTKPSKSYTITYNGNGGTAGSANKSVSCTFKNWNTNAAGTGTAYNAGASYNANSSATLYAQWQNPAVGNLASASRTGYTFDGWYTAASGGSKVTTATAITGNTTLYAHWIIGNCTITYDANGGNKAPMSQTKEYGKNITLSSEEPTKYFSVTFNPNGGECLVKSAAVFCTFKGWNTTATGTGTAYSAGSSYTANASATLYAQWENSKLNGEVFATREGYTLEGWYTEPTGGILVTKDTIIDKNMTVYAHWKANLSVTVTVSNAELMVGENTVVQAQASGGSGTYTYRYQIHNLETDGWSYVTEETASPTYTWIAQTAGTREFYVEVRDSNGEVARSEAVKVEVKAKEKPLSITGKASVSEVAVGNTVTISATATGGTGNYTYSFLIHNLENDTWYRWAFDKSAQHVWTASGSGSREFFAEVKDAAGTVVRSAAMKVTVKAYDVPLTITGNVSKHQVNAGEQVVIYAAVAGGSGNYTYSFLIHNLDTDAWYRFGDFGTASQYVWTANGSGNREFFAEVKDAAGTVVRSESLKVTVGNGSETGALQIHASADKNQVTSGTAVTISAAAAGGSGNYTYSFLVHNLANDSWYRFGGFAEASSYTWTAGSAGTREFFVEAKDGNGTVVRSSAVTIVVK